MIYRTHGAIQLLKMIRQRGLRIDVERRAKFFNQRIQPDTFALEFVSDVMKLMHKDHILCTGGESSRLGSGELRRVIKNRASG